MTADTTATPGEMTTEMFARWLAGLLEGGDEQRCMLARPDVLTLAVEMIHGEAVARPTVVACFPAGTFIISVAKAAP